MSELNKHYICTVLNSENPTFINSFNIKLKENGYSDINIQKVVEIININNNKSYILCENVVENIIKCKSFSNDVRLKLKNYESHPPISPKGEKKGYAESSFIVCYDFENENELKTYDSMIDITPYALREYLYKIEVNENLEQNQEQTRKQGLWRLWTPDMNMYTFDIKNINIPYTNHKHKTDVILSSFSTVSSFISKLSYPHNLYLVSKNKCNKRYTVKFHYYVVISSTSDLGILDGELRVL